MINPDFSDIGSSVLAYKKFGNGKVQIVVETSLNSCMGEWWHLAEKLSETYTVLLYERAGYGRSSKSSLPRTPKNISEELHKLISSVDHDDKMIFIGHSQGGLYLQQYARMYPDTVRGLVLIDPLSANDNKWRELLNEDEFKKSGADKTVNLRLGYSICRIGLGFLLRPLIKMSPPFYYYKGFSRDAVMYILSALTKAKQYKTALEEYELSHRPEETECLKKKEGFPDVPIVLITHASDFVMKETIYFGGASEELAQKVENIWQDLMKEYLSFSSNSRHIQAKDSGHFLHLTEFSLVEEALAFIC